MRWLIATQSVRRDVLSSSTKGRSVPEYRIYLFQGGHIDSAQTIDVEDDAAAFNHASGSNSGKPFEIWKGAQMVVSLDAPPPNIAASASGAGDPKIRCASNPGRARPGS
jgi:hypothetical protein